MAFAQGLSARARGRPRRWPTAVARGRGATGAAWRADASGDFLALARRPGPPARDRASSIPLTRAAPRSSGPGGPCPPSTTRSSRTPRWRRCGSSSTTRRASRAGGPASATIGAGGDGQDGDFTLYPDGYPDFPMPQALRTRRRRPDGHHLLPGQRPRVPVAARADSAPAGARIAVHVEIPAAEAHRMGAQRVGGARVPARARRPRHAAALAAHLQHEVERRLGRAADAAEAALAAAPRRAAARPPARRARARPPGSASRRAQHRRGRVVDHARPASGCPRARRPRRARRSSRSRRRRAGSGRGARRQRGRPCRGGQSKTQTRS